MRFKSLLTIALLSNVLVYLSGCAVSFPDIQVADIEGREKNIEGQIIPAWHKYVFDIKVVTDDGGKVQLDALSDHKIRIDNDCSRALVFASSIGTSSVDGPGRSVHGQMVLWQEPTLERSKGSVHLKLYIEEDSYNLTAQFGCSIWATRSALITVPDLLKNLLDSQEGNWSKDLPLMIPIETFSLWDLKTNTVERLTPIPIKLGRVPYWVDEFLVIPVIIHLKSADFASNCLAD